MEDDAAAGGDEDYRREGQDEEEAEIKQMLERAREAAERARQRAITGAWAWVQMQWSGAVRTCCKDTATCAG